jgi:hypothetical protein
VSDALRKRDLDPKRKRWEERLDAVRVPDEPVGSLGEIFNDLRPYAEIGGLTAIGAAAAGHPDLMLPAFGAGFASSNIGVKALYAVNKRLSDVQEEDYVQIGNSISNLAKESSDVEVRGLEEPYEPVSDFDDDIKTYTHIEDGNLYYGLVDSRFDIAVSGRVPDWERKYSEEDDGVLGMGRYFVDE